MRDVAHRVSRIALAAVACTFLPSCSGGSGDPPPPQASCSRPAIPATGPGDTANHFPSEVGWTWTSRVQSDQSLLTMTVAGTEQVGTELAAVFNTSGLGSVSVERVVERPSGVYVLADASTAAPQDRLYPELILPFPLAVTPSAPQGSCTSLDMGDLDGDGKHDYADMALSLGVVSVTDTRTVAAGTFTGLVDVQHVVSVTVRTTASGTVTVVTTEDDWFAPGVGRVARRAVVTAPGVYDSDELTLVSFQAPVVVPGAALTALTAAQAVPEPSRAERALEAARKVFAARL